MPVVISLINLKGGVGKTTLTVALAEFMAVLHGLKVLVIDLDPQTNATVALIDENEWRRRNVRGQTVLSAFTDRFSKYRIFSPDEAIIKNVSNVGGGIEGLDLLPSSIDLIEFQDDFVSEPDRFRGDLQAVLRDEMQDTLKEYDVVLIDCPPDLGFITRNGILISNYYLIPVIPDVLSTYGIPQIINRINRLKKQAGIRIKPLGLVVNKFRVQASVHRNQLRVLKANAARVGYQRVFASVISENGQVAAVMDSSLSFPSLQKKYGYNRPYEEYKQLTQEVLAYVRR